MKKLILIILLCVVSQPAWAKSNKRGSEIKFLGLYNMTMPTTNDAAANALYDPKGDFGGGLFLEIAFGKVLGFEFGGAYSPYSYKVADAASLTDLTTKWNSIHAPAIFKFHFGSVFSLGLGGYFNYAFGKAKTSGTLVGVTVSAENDITNDYKTDYGAIGTMGFNFGLGKSCSFLIEGRVLAGMKDFDTSSNTLKYHHVQGWAGLAFKL